MTQKNETVTVNYTDGEGIAYEMTIIRHFTFGDQQFVLTVEKDKHHHEGGACACHDHHNHEDSDSSKAKPLYVFEWITGSETGKLQSVSEEILKALAPILEAM
nr:DUF1292 domain-containing protein [uncultured Acetobacterium sp.]